MLKHFIWYKMKGGGGDTDTADTSHTVPEVAHRGLSRFVSLCDHLQNTELSGCPPLWLGGCDAQQLNEKINWTN